MRIVGNRLIRTLSFLTVVSLVIAPATALAVETPSVKDTNYPIPSGAVFVATSGNDSGAGTEAEPFRTIARALEVVRDGGTVVIRTGTYREGDLYLGRAVHLQPYPHEKVWLKGSAVVTGWTPDGPNWRVDGWTHEFDGDTYGRAALDPAFPYAGMPDQLFVDGMPLRQVGSIDEVAGRTFYVDDIGDRLYMGVDPAGKTVEASIREQAINVGTGKGASIRGLGLMHYAGHRFQGTLQVDGGGATFEHNTVAWNASKGITIYNSTGSLVQGNAVINNGQMGIGGWRTVGLRVLANRLAGNNRERFMIDGPVAEAAGAKITQSKDVLLRDNIVEQNLGSGLWLDVSVYECVVAGNLVRDNSSFGVFYEISANGIIAGNVIVDNHDAAIAVSNASNVQVYNNTLVDNAMNIAVFDDDRVNDDPDEIKLGITRITANVVIRNNVFYNTDGKQEHLFARDFDSEPLKDAEELFGDCDYNAYSRKYSSQQGNLIQWWRGATRNDYASLAEFRAATRFENHGITIGVNDSSRFFVDESRGDYHLRARSVARQAGCPLPADVAGALGLTPGVPVDLGAFQFNGE